MIHHTELIKDKFYSYGIFIFKYKKQSEEFLYDYGYALMRNNGTYRYIESDSPLCDITDLIGYDFYEIDINEIIKYLPDSNIDKIIYKRKFLIKGILK